MKSYEATKHIDKFPKGKPFKTDVLSGAWDVHNIWLHNETGSKPFEK